MNGSIVVRRSLGRQLRALRSGSHKTSADVTAAGIASKAKLARIEAGSSPVKMADVRALCWLYGADPTTTDTLAEMAMNTAGQGWWEDYSDVVPSWFGLYVELEAAASSIWTWDAELIHGLLQTPEYHRAVFEVDPVLRSADSADRQVRLRAERQRSAFDRRPPLLVTAVIGAGALERLVGGRRVMVEQRARLFDHAQQENVHVHVLPWQAGAHVGMKGAFTVLGFNALDDPDVVYLETLAGGRYVEQPDMVQRYRNIFDIIVAQSVPIEEYIQ